MPQSQLFLTADLININIKTIQQLNTSSIHEKKVRISVLYLFRFVLFNQQLLLMHNLLKLQILIRILYLLIWESSSFDKLSGRGFLTSRQIDNKFIVRTQHSYKKINKMACREYLNFKTFVSMRPARQRCQRVL